MNYDQPRPHGFRLAVHGVTAGVLMLQLSCQCPPPAGGFDAATPGADSCMRTNVSAVPIPAHMLIALDASGSMFQPAMSIDRWTPAVGAVNAVTGALQSNIRFGLMRFPGDESCGAGSVAVAPAPMAAASIGAALAGDPEMLTGGGTPIASTLQAAHAVLGGLDGDRFVLLVTDGAPNCNTAILPEQCQCAGAPSFCASDVRNCLDVQSTVTQTQQLAAAGIRTFVIGFDTSEWATVLDQIAAAGGTPRTTYIPVSDGAALESALLDVSRSILPCTYELDRPPADIRFVSVRIDSVMIDHESVQMNGSGWRLVGATTIELLGPSCDAIQDGLPHAIEIGIECEPVLI